MTRASCLSAYKGNHASRKRQQAHGSAPLAGSHLEHVYRALRRGEVVRGLEPHERRQLQDYYGVELAGRRGRGGGTWLVGEWDGPIYMTLEQVMAEEQARDVEAAA